MPFVLGQVEHLLGSFEQVDAFVLELLVESGEVVDLAAAFAGAADVVKVGAILDLVVLHNSYSVQKFTSLVTLFSSWVTVCTHCCTCFFSCPSRERRLHDDSVGRFTWC